MPLFERSYRAAAKEDIERKIREIETKRKKAQTMEDVEETEQLRQIVANNIAFAETIKLITIEKANDFREQLLKSAEEFDNVLKEDVQKIEKREAQAGGKQMTMEEATGKIEQLKAQDVAKEAEKQKAAAQKVKVEEGPKTK